MIKIMTGCVTLVACCCSDTLMGFCLTELMSFYPTVFSQSLPNKTTIFHHITCWRPAAWLFSVYVTLVVFIIYLYTSTFCTVERHNSSCHKFSSLLVWRVSCHLCASFLEHKGSFSRQLLRCSQSHLQGLTAWDTHTHTHSEGAMLTAVHPLPPHTHFPSSSPISVHENGLTDGPLLIQARCVSQPTRLQHNGIRINGVIKRPGRPSTKTERRDGCMNGLCRVTGDFMEYSGKEKVPCKCQVTGLIPAAVRKSGHTLISQSTHLLLTGGRNWSWPFISLSPSLTLSPSLPPSPLLVAEAAELNLFTVISFSLE